jgi:hypothetical protein
MEMTTMSDVQQQLDAIRQEMDRLSRDVQALRPWEEQAGGDNIPQTLQRLVLEEIERKGKPCGIIVLRGVVMRNPGGTATQVGRISITDTTDLPSEEKMAERAAAIGINLLILRTLRYMAKRYLNGESLRVTQAELATALGADAAELESALVPLVEREWLRWSKTGHGEEYYEWQPNDSSLVLLTLI